MQPNEHNTRPRYSERDMHNERQALAAKIRCLHRPKAQSVIFRTWNEAIEAAAKIAEA